MRKLSEKIELLVNIGIIFTALVFCGILSKLYFWPAQERGVNANLDPRIPAGTKIYLPDVAWSSERTLLLALSTKCHYCSESAPFYRQLVKAVEGQMDVKLVALLPEEINESEQYLKNLDVAINDVKRAPLKQINVMATPTLLLVDNSGTVINSWLGRLTTEEEGEVLSVLRGGSAKRFERADDQTSSIEAVNLQKMIKGGTRLIIVDVRERPEYRQRHIAGAINIPFDELSVRASNELKASDFIVVYSDCARCANDEKGRAAQETLNSLGFGHSVVLQGGIESWTQADPLSQNN
jgi:rhodanese-related sulfurtransferase